MKKILKNYIKNAKSDLACEFVRSKKTKSDDLIKVFEVCLNDTDAEKIGKRAGKYVTIDTSVVLNVQVEKYNRVCIALKEELSKFIQGRNILVVGLGNYKIGADSLGVKVCNKVEPTRNIISSNYCVSVISPGVVGSTGIESYEVVKGVCKTIKPDTIIVIDSLCAGSLSRLLTTFQITDTGITPGSGVNNHRLSFNKENLNANVVSIGVPTVVYASTLIREFDGRSFESNLVVSPKDIDYLIKDCANIIATALNSIFLDNHHFN